MEDYRFPAVETAYRDVVFRSRLEARWAAMFDLMGWRWQYEPVELDGWFPDFFVGYQCWHSGCTQQGEPFKMHWFLAEVKPYHSVEQFAGHRANRYQWCREGWGGEGCFWDGVMFCGVSHETCRGEGSHGWGGGVNDLRDFGDFAGQWQRAGVMTQWKR